MRLPFGKEKLHIICCIGQAYNNSIKHCYRADKKYTLFEPSLKVLCVKFGWGSHFIKQRMVVK